MTQSTPDDVRKYVREHYSEIALSGNSSQSSCCGDDLPSGNCCSPSKSSQVENLIQIDQLYQAAEVTDLPEEVLSLSLGCGDPVTLAELQPGQTVLDLGAGGGIDCFIAAKRVKPGGKVIGVDMTPAMLEKARLNKEKLRADNVEFRLGEIENLPVADVSVDVIISNCVINLSPDKPKVFREAFRVLRPGGKLAVSDIVTQGALPKELKDSLTAWAGCISGALDVNDYVGALEDAGFINIKLVPSYFVADEIHQAVDQSGIDKMSNGSITADLERSIFSAKITAFKPID